MQIVDLISVGISYLLGSFPSAYLIAKIKGVDIIKKVRNGHLGTASTIREVGKFPGLLVALTDFSKGAISIMLAETLSGKGWVMVLSGIAAIVGHNWSIFLGFSGGKGAATTFGDIFYLLPFQFFWAAGILIPLSLFLRKKEFFALPVKKRSIKTSNFLTLTLFILISFFALISGFSKLYILSPFLFSPPILLKKNR
ncbi:MAG: hypothetical protein CO034_00045 [Parcubacteria group bacterium CG_4_9_14_0_2_um_filter_35_11]|nr:MAG: hypothetical protein CO034_00045 [Parcubacteria group bacterium CG_4_9_14_0_2_um_filter_35_11]